MSLNSNNYGIVDDDTVVAEVENAALDLAEEFGFLIAVDDNNTVAVVAQADDKSDVVAAEIGNTALELAVYFGFLSVDVADDNNIAAVVDYKGEVTVDNNNVEDIDHILVVENTALEVASNGSDYFAPGLVAGRIVDVDSYENIAYAIDIDHLDDYQNHLSLIYRNNLPFNFSVLFMQRYFRLLVLDSFFFTECI